MEGGGAQTERETGDLISLLSFLMERGKKFIPVYVQLSLYFSLEFPYNKYT
jgi:hypothetical protein